MPATLRKCDLYKPRGQFVYKPGRVKEPSRRKKASAVRVLKRDESGELKEAQAPRPARRAEPRERPSVPRTVEVGTDDRAILRAVLKELYAEAHPDAGREMHGRFEGGKAKVVQVDGRECAISSEDLFRMLERFRASLEALEDALVSKDALLDQFAEMQKQLRSVQGSMTTFNFLYASRDDYFSGKP